MYYTSKEVYEYISQTKNDPIVEWKTCRISGTAFPIFQSDIDFYTKINQSFPWQGKMSEGRKALIPTLCPEERQRRRLSFRNERKLYKRQCDFSGKDIISMYKPSSSLTREGDPKGGGFKVYDLPIRRSDKRDAKTYGRDFDFTRTFTEQFGALMRDVPKFNLTNDSFSENSNYVNQTTYQKNCYFTFDADQDEDCLYSNAIKFSKNCVDTTNVYYCEQNYQLINCTKCFHCLYCLECNNSQYCLSCTRCKDCLYCFECKNLSNRKYYFRNHACASKEEYIDKVSQVIDGWTDYLPTQGIHRAVYTINDEWSCGSNLSYTKNCIFSYQIDTGEDIKYSTCLNNAKNSYDHDIWWINSEYIYESVTVGENAYNVLFCAECRWNTKNIAYCYQCIGCTNCFGCVGLKHQEYCIFNTQYSKEEYEQTLTKIVTHMIQTEERWEFFHPSLSPFGYNETVAHEHSPMQSVGTHLYASSNKENSYTQFGYFRSTYSSDPVIAPGIEVIMRSNYSNDQRKNLRDDNDIIKKVFICEISQRPYKIQPAELKFYRTLDLDLPSKHPDIRHDERMQRKSPRELHLRTCDKTKQQILSVFPADAPFQVYSEQAYNHEVYG